MKQNFYDFNEVSTGKTTLTINYNNEAIESFLLPAISIGEDYQEYQDGFNFESHDYVVDVFLSSAGTQVTISTEYDNGEMDDFELTINEGNEEENKVIVDYYVPTAPFTKTLSSALYGLANNTTIVPMIDVENISKFDDYFEDDLIDFKHYLDLSSMKHVVNQEIREKAKEKRKKEKKELGHMKTSLPSPEEKVIDLSKKIEYYKKVQDKKQAIPVYLWNEDATVVQLKQFVNELKDNFKKFSIRVLDKNTFLRDISEIKELEDFTLFLDLNTNFNVSNIKSYLAKFDKHFNHIVYLGAHFLPAQMTIPSDALNENHIRENFPIVVYEELKTIYPSLKYGDYCGFDRKTLSSMPKGGRPSARVILEDLDSSKKVLIRRGWDEQDKTISKDSGKIKIGMIYSMHKLLCDIQKGELDYVPYPNGIKFIDERICDADAALKSYCPERTTPGEVKTLCIRHNIFSVKYNYMPEKEII